MEPTNPFPEYRIDFTYNLADTKWHHIPNHFPYGRFQSAEDWVEELAETFANSEEPKNRLSEDEWLPRVARFLVPKPVSGDFREWFFREPDEDNNNAAMMVSVIPIAETKDGTLEGALDPMPELVGSEAKFFPFLSETMGLGMKAVKLLGHRRADKTIETFPNISFAFQSNDLFFTFGVTTPTVKALANCEKEVEDFVNSVKLTSIKK